MPLPYSKWVGVRTQMLQDLAGSILTTLNPTLAHTQCDNALNLSCVEREREREREKVVEPTMAICVCVR